MSIILFSNKKSRQRILKKLEEGGLRSSAYIQLKSDSLRRLNLRSVISNEREEKIFLRQQVRWNTYCMIHGYYAQWLLYLRRKLCSLQDKVHDIRSFTLYVASQHKLLCSSKYLRAFPNMVLTVTCGFCMG